MSIRYQECCEECNCRKFFIVCLTDHTESVDPHEFLAICSNCGRQRDIDDLIWNEDHNVKK